MKNLKKHLYFGAFVVPVVIAMAVAASARAEIDTQLPGREVGLIESRSVMGAACGSYKSMVCILPCDGNGRAGAGIFLCSAGSAEACSMNCKFPQYEGACGGG